MTQLMNALLAMSNELYVGLSFACVILITLCSIFVIVVVLVQQGNSSGISALGGSTDTFYGKNKSKTLESKLKKLTVICLAVIGVLCVLFYIISLL